MSTSIPSSFPCGHTSLDLCENSRQLFISQSDVTNDVSQVSLECLDCRLPQSPEMGSMFGNEVPTDSLSDTEIRYRKSGNFRCSNIFVWVAGIQKLNARKFFSNEYLRHLFSTATGCEKEQELLASRLCKCLLAPGYHAVYCTPLHKKSEQSFFARVKVRRLLSLVSIRRVVGIPVALQHLSNMLW